MKRDKILSRSACSWCARIDAVLVNTFVFAHLCNPHGLNMQVCGSNSPASVIHRRTKGSQGHNTFRLVEDQSLCRINISTLLTPKQTVLIHHKLCLFDTIYMTDSPQFECKNTLFNKERNYRPTFGKVSKTIESQ